jgi:hypothetical protein
MPYVDDISLSIVDLRKPSAVTLCSAYISIGILTVADDVLFSCKQWREVAQSEMDEKIQRKCGRRFGCVGT